MVQEIALGFPDDVPNSEQLLINFLEGKGSWAEAVKIPTALVDEGRRLVDRLIRSGKISGFKDPRTVLTWPFWREVLREFPTLRVVVVPLLRSPHQIAMSLCTRSEGAYGYWSALDLVAVHFDRIKAIVASEAQASTPIRFGSQSFLDDLAEATRFCGLTWNHEAALRVFDRACVHHEPASVFHEAQSSYEGLGGPQVLETQTAQNGWLLARDARKCEAMTSRLLAQAHESCTRHKAKHAEQEQVNSQVQHERSMALYEVSQTRDELARVQAALSDSRDQVARACDELNLAHENENRLWDECQRLRHQRDRFESHPVLGRLLRTRRRVRGLLAGSSRATRDVAETSAL
jgi:hypothetical protein